jgi:hypothetical protein
MATVANAKSIGPLFNNAEEIVSAFYDFSVDAGAQGSLDIFTAAADVIVTHFHMEVETTCTGTNAVLTVSTTDELEKYCSASQGAVAKLVAGYNLVGPWQGVKIASGEKIYQTIATAALTAGKIKYVIRYVNA